MEHPDDQCHNTSMRDAHKIHALEGHLSHMSTRSFMHGHEAWHCPDPSQAVESPYMSIPYTHC